MKLLKIIVCVVLGFCATNVWANQESEFVPDADTVALWHLNGSGDDASGNSNHLAVKTDRVGWVSGKFGQCAEMGDDPWSGSCFNSDGGALTAPGSGCTYPGSGDWTVEAWVCFPSNSKGYYAVSHYSKHWAGHDPYHLGVSNGQAFFTLADSSNNSLYISADISAYVGQWVHLAGVYRYQQDAVLYVNGVQVAYEATTLVIEYLPGYDVFVGGHYCGTSSGLKVDEVRISNVARYPEPAEPGEGWIAFVSSQGGDADIWAVRPDGTGLKQLTNLPGNQGTPQWSSDSTKIVYCYQEEAQIWVYDWFTGTNTKIYDGDDYGGQHYLFRAALSPDGSKILFTEQKTYNNPHVTVINADGTERKEVPVEPGYVGNTSWSPTSRAFVYERRNSFGGTATSDLWIYDFTASGDIMNGINHRLTAGATGLATTKVNPDWAPSGEIVFCWSYNLAVIDPGQSPNWIGPVSDPLDPNVTFLYEGHYAGPAWSPDASQIVTDLHDPDSHMWIVDASPDGNRYPLTGILGSGPDWGNPAAEPEWSFVHMTDTHIGYSGTALVLGQKPWQYKRVFLDGRSRFAEALEEVGQLDPQPHFVLITGDIVEHPVHLHGLPSLYREYCAALKPFHNKNPGIKVYAVPGNHDREFFCLNIGLDQYNATIGVPPDTNKLPETNDYYFDHKDIITFVGLDSGAGCCSAEGLTEDQLEALETRLSNTDTKVIFMHHPVFDDEPSPECDSIGLDQLISADTRKRFIQFCEQNNVELVLTGHTHEDHTFDVNGVKYIQTPSVGKNNPELPLSPIWPRGYRIVDIQGGLPVPQPYQPVVKSDKKYAKLWSPATLHAYDGLGRHTGSKDSNEFDYEIPHSYYFGHLLVPAEDSNQILPETVLIFDPCDDYHYEVVGTETGTYRLEINSIVDGNETIFEANEIPTLAGSVHQYIIDWDALSECEEGVTLRVDMDGDGDYEKIIISDCVLTGEEFALQTETVVDFAPDTLNLKSQGKTVTVYIELPTGFDVGRIDISTLKLNDLVPALSKPFEIGDHDNDGIDDLMVKFDREVLIQVVQPGEQIIDLTGRLNDGTLLAGTTQIRVID